MESRHWTGDDNTSADDMTDRELEARERELEENGAAPLTREERFYLTQAQAIAAAIRKAATFSS